MSTGAWLLHRVKIYKRIRRLDGIAAAETAGMLCHSSHFCKCTIRCKMGKVSDRRRRRTNANDHDRDRSFLCSLSVCPRWSLVVNVMEWSRLPRNFESTRSPSSATTYRLSLTSLPSHLFLLPSPVTNAAAAVVAMVYYNVMAVR